MENQKVKVPPVKSRRLKSHQIKSKFTWFEWSSLVVLVVYSVGMLALLLWGLMNSVKTSGDFTQNIMGLPKVFTFENYGRVLTEFTVEATQNKVVVEVTFIGMLVNSFLYAVIGAIINTAVPCLMAYMTQRFKCWYSKAITAIVIVTMTIPVVGDAPAKIQLLDSMGLFNTMLGSWILKFSFLGMYFLVFVAAFEGVNKAYYEAAYIDGASEPRVLVSVGLPMVRNVFFTVCLLRFIFYWNDYETTLLYLPDHPVLARGIYELSRSTNFQAIPERLAGCMVLLLPIMIIYFAFSKQLMSNISMGGVKE